jgi:hypothetical protein
MCQPHLVKPPFYPLQTSSFDAVVIRIGHALALVGLILEFDLSRTIRYGCGYVVCPLPFFATLRRCRQRMLPRGEAGILPKHIVQP